MRVQLEQLSVTRVKLIITADQEVMDQIKQATVTRLGHDVRVPGFRPGKAPAAMVEKSIGSSQLQNDFLEQAINHFYIEAVQKEKLRPAAQPEINILKFVPFTTLEFTVEFDAVGKVKLADYRKFKLAMKTTPVTTEDIKAVLDDLLQRGAIREPLDRAAKIGDEVIIDFKGRDANTDEPINGADSAEYPLLLGSNSFIPGFEEKLVGLKAGEETEFTLAFPKDYGAAELQNRKVIFKVTVHKVQAVTTPKADDAFAASIGPFTSLAELKTDIKKQLTAERQRSEQQAYESELLQKLAEESEMILPEVLVEEEMNQMEAEERRNIAYRGQTWQEHLTQEGVAEEEHHERYRLDAIKRLRAGLAMAEVGDQENMNVSQEELSAHIARLKQQYGNDATMLAELDKPENRRDLVNRLFNQKVLDTLRDFATKNANSPSKAKQAKK